MERWLFLDSGPAPGAENMALDELLLERAEGERRAPVLRLYTFDPPAITIGAHQDPLEILDFARVRSDGLDCVRRITGGRALLHEGELTYCVVAPAGAAGLGNGRAETFMRISAALRAALRSLGAGAEVSRGREIPRPHGAAPPCLSSVTRAELTVGGKKIAGSAQRMSAGAVLQHGSILARPGSSRIVKYLRGSWDSLEARVTSIEEEIGRPVEAHELRAAIVRAFSELFGVAWAPLSLTDAERAAVGERAAEKRREMSECLAGEVSSP